MRDLCELKQSSNDTPMPLYSGTAPATVMKQPEDKPLKISLSVRHRHCVFLGFLLQLYNGLCSFYFSIFLAHRLLTFALWYPHRHCGRRGTSLAVMGHADWQCFIWPRRRGVRWRCRRLRWHDAAHKLERVICVR